MMKIFTIKSVFMVGMAILLMPALFTTKTYAQWETLFDKATNLNNSPGEYFVKGDTILIGRGGGGLFYSYDNGANWNDPAVTPIGSNAKLGKFFYFQGRLYAHRIGSGSNNFVRSEADDITQWSVVKGMHQYGDDHSGISQVATNGTVIFAVSFPFYNDAGVAVTDMWVSDDGEEWTNMGLNPGYGHITFDGDELYAMAGPSLMTSSDNGANWTEISALADSLSPIDLQIDEGSVYVVARNESQERKYLYKWELGGTEWIKLLGAKTSNIQFSAENGALATFVFGGELSYSPDGGSTWASKSRDEIVAYSVLLHGDYVYTTTRGSFFGVDLLRVPTSSFVEFTSNENDGSLPKQIQLNQNYPNPFNPTTNIRYELMNPGNVDLRVFDITGREVAVLEQAFKPAGSYTVAADLSGLSSGMYFYQLNVNGEKLTKKMTLLK